MAEVMGVVTGKQANEKINLEEMDGAWEHECPVRINVPGHLGEKLEVGPQYDVQSTYAHVPSCAPSSVKNIYVTCHSCCRIKMNRIQAGFIIM